MTQGFPLVPLSDVLSHYQEYIDVPETKEYPKLSVKLYGKGVTLDTPANGASLKMKRHQLAKKGQVILSEIWGKKGAIGFVPEAGDGALCTSHFFLFDVCTDRLDPRYLQAIFTANYLQAQLDSGAHGTTGYAAVRPKQLLAATIPLPSLAEQRRIVARIEALAAQINEARGLRREAVVGTQTLVNQALSELITNGKQNGWQTKPLGDYILDDCYGTSEKTHDDRSGTPILRMGNIQNGRLEAHDLNRRFQNRGIGAARAAI